MTAIYPGSFDPVTFGHLDIIRRAAGIFDEVVVAVMVNSEKRYLFSDAERADMMTRACEGIANVKIVYFEGLTVDLVRRYSDAVLIKGVRSASDFDYEAMIAEANRASGGVETVFLFASPEYSRLSSLVVREFASQGADVSNWAPDHVCKILRERFQ